MKDPFEEYLRQGEPDSATRADLWQVAIGLQAVDGLKPSRYLIETAQKHIVKDLNIDQVEARISSYYKSAEGRKEVEGTEEADIVATRITRLLSEQKFTFSPAMLSSIHRTLFGGVLTHAGKYRTYNITKKEWVLDGDTVLYAPADSLGETLSYDFGQEKKFSYRDLDKYETISHLAFFVSGIWQIHPFGEGNTRTTAVFTIKYLQSLGFEVDNAPFKLHSWYFRNALVRANYRNLAKGVERTTKYLQQFLRNILFGEKNELKNRYLHIRWNEFSDGGGMVSDYDVPFFSKIGSVENSNGSVETGRSSVETRNSSVENSNSSVEREGSSVEIVRMMEVTPKITAAQIAEKLGITVRAVEKQIAKLRNQGKIERVGPKKGGQWKVLQP